MAPKVSNQHAKGSSSTTSKAKGKDYTRKATPKQPLGIPERLKRLFTSLCAQIDGGHYSNAIKTCDKILRLEPKDPDAKQTKLFLLLQTEQYDAALSLIDHDGENPSHAFETAYSLYRLQREAKAKDIVQSIKDDEDVDNRGVVHLEAQLSYREGSYDTALQLYNELLDTAEPGSEEHSDILINLQASQQHLDFINTGFLHSLDSLPTAVTSTIETNPPPTQVNTQVTAALASLTRDTAERVHPAEKKVRKSRVPAGVIPGVTPPPDPERWLKKIERSMFGQGKRRKGPGGGGGGATQGSASVESAPAVSSPSHTKPSAIKGKKRK
ncbi:hypothetical protein BDZ94DRAFT_788803 [Collybia nuda]|uniref:Signal recognition particle subunit SRP72 n=1 Tax=Collybia nuda TaxID=64659 RepID=A0A9P5Y355_9AGAR|nr:hypothetical protein BDZ94DRAFT_788803 [Collybia nuda]